MLALLFLSVLAASFVTAAPERISTSPTLVRSSSRDTTEFVSAAWFSGWLITDTSTINWQDLTHAKWSFAVTTPDPGTISLAASGPSYISDFVTQAKAYNVKASISIGGWSGSQYFSSAVAPANRTKFINAIIDMVDTYNLDGCDFDWEYPGGSGIGCNEVSSSDSDNFLGFLQDLRTATAGRNLYLTAAVSPTTFIGSNGQPMTDVSGFAQVLDNIAIMNYDINGQWSSQVGPNAPLISSCSTVSTTSATDAVKAWTAARFPANKITLGVPSYGHTFNVNPSNAVNSGNLVLNAPFIENPLSGETDQCGTPVRTSDIVTFADMITKGLLNTDGTPANGVKSQFDDCSQTPFLYDETNQMMYSYDDPQSFAAKGRFIIDQNLLGFSMWDASGDYSSLLVGSLTSAVDVTDC